MCAFVRQCATGPTLAVLYYKKLVLDAFLKSRKETKGTSTVSNTGQSAAEMTPYQRIAI